MPRTLTSSALCLTISSGLSALACSDSTGVQPEDLAGTWRATSAVATNVVDPTETVDLVASGATITFTIEASGAVEIVFEFEGTTDRDPGTMTVIGDEFRLLIDGRESTGTLSRQDDTLTINVLTGLDWDFGDDGISEPAMFALIMQRVV